MANTSPDSDEIEWNVNVEILLFYAMMGSKPVGVSRNITMLTIHQRFCEYINKQIRSSVIWKHLDSMYDMA
ncbi:MRG-binding protein, partial [Stegodyphus mimosarum]